MKRPPWFRRLCAGTLTLALIGGTTVALPLVASAATTTLFSQTFRDSTLTGSGPVVKPAATGNLPNTACLTATGGDGVPPSCPTGSTWVNDQNGSGALSLTPAQNNRVGGVFASTSVPTSQGLDLSFTVHQWSAGTPADGLLFALSAVDPNNPTPPPNIGPAGGSLGYNAVSGADGLANAYMGLGFDVYGHFTDTNFFGRVGCSASVYARPGRTPNQVTLRGPGNGQSGYCAIDGTSRSSSAAAVPMHGTTREGSRIPVRVLLNSSALPITTGDGLTVAAESYRFDFTPIGASTATTLQGSLPAMQSSYVGAPSWLDAQGLPKQLAFGWAASTGGFNDNHEVRDVTVRTLTAAVPQLQVTTTSYTPSANLAPGDPVSYVVTPAVATGTDDPGPLAVRLTSPAGVKLRYGDGNGWTCTPASDQTMTCQNPNGPFTAGQALPPITVTATAVSSVTAQTVQTSSSTTASSDTGQAAISTSAPTGANPTTPVITRITSAIGQVGGGNQVTLSGAHLNGVTALRVGTPEELANGIDRLIMPCSPNSGFRCFTTTPDGDLVVANWVSHAAGEVVVSAVALGTAGSSTYTYMRFAANDVQITEFRASGPQGDGDEYVEITNTSSGPKPLANLYVQDSSGEFVQLPTTAPTLATGGTYLVAGPDYSLTAVAAPDFTLPSALLTGGVRLLAESYGAVDQVGPSSAPAGFFDGQGLTPFDSAQPRVAYAWVRTQQTGTFKNTDSNAADFALVSTDGGVVSGVQSMLGSPSPSSTTSPANLSSVLPSRLVDPSKSANVAPNRVVTKSPGVPGGRIETRRVITNNTGATVTSVQLRLIDITQENGLTPLAGTVNPPYALLKAVPPQQSVVTVRVNGQDVTVRNLAPTGVTAADAGGGLNSTFVVPLTAGGLAPGQSATIGLTLTASTSGQFSFRYSTEALLAQ